MQALWRKHWVLTAAKNPPDSDPGMLALWELGGVVTSCVWCVSGVDFEDLG